MDILQSGIDFIKIIQQFRTPSLDIFFSYITTLAGTTFAFVLLSYLFWCFDRKTAARMIIVFCVSYWLNAFTKELLQQPRPFDLAPEVMIGHASGPGLPSGHAQASFTLWGFAALWINKSWFYILASVFILLIALSRLYLGVHFPTDIIGGWILSCIVLYVDYKYHDKIKSTFLSINVYAKTSFISIVCMLMAVSIPTKWTVSSAAVLLGFCAGYFLSKQPDGFRLSGNLPKKLLRFVLGFFVLAMILKLPENYIKQFDNIWLFLIFIQYCIAGLWISLFAPKAFKIFKIADFE